MFPGGKPARDLVHVASVSVLVGQGEGLYCQVKRSVSRDVNYRRHMEVYTLSRPTEGEVASKSL